MPTSTMAVRPSSDLSDSNSDFYSAGEEEDLQDEEDLEDGQDSDDEDELDVQDDETSNSVNFVVPSLQRKSTTIPIRKNVTSNGVGSKKTLDNEIIICENGASNSSSSNLSSAGNNGAGFDPLNTEEKDPLDIDIANDEVKNVSNPRLRQLPNSPDSEYRTDDGKVLKISLPVIKINRVAGEAQDEGWKIKRKPEVNDSRPEVPSKRVRTNRQAVSYAEIEDDESPKLKQRGRPRVNPPLTPHPSKQKQPQQLQTPKATKEKATPTYAKRGRRKRNDSEDSFEIMPYKRRQFRGASEVDVEDEDTKDDILRTSTPTIPDVDEMSSTARRSKPKSSEKRVKAKSKEQKDESRQQSSERDRKMSDSNSMSTSQLNTSSIDGGESKKTKRGRPRKIDVERRNNVSSFETTSRDSFASPPRRRKSKAAYDDDDSRMTNSTFGFDFEDSTYDTIEVGEIVDMDDDFKFPRRSQARPGPVKNMDHTIFPRLTADELVSCFRLFTYLNIIFKEGSVDETPKLNSS